MKNKRILNGLVATILFLTPVFPNAVYAQDSSEDIFGDLEDVAVPDEPDSSDLESLPGEAMPSPDAATENAFDAYRDALEVDENGNAFIGEAGNGEGNEATPSDLEAEIREEAFNAAVNGFLPLRPEEIRRFLEIYDEVKQASNTPVYPYPKQESKVQEISLDPADPPQVIKLATGHVTHVAFYDATGAKWPIANVAWAGNFEFNYPEKDEGGSTLRIIPMSDFAYGNMIVTFSKLQTPAIFTLQAQREMVHVRYDGILPEPGPFAKPSLIGKSPGPATTSGSVQVVSVLDGTPPQSASQMDVKGVDTRTKAYNLGGEVYLRTPHTLISPAWSESASSGDGINVYVIKNTPVVLLSEKGKIIRAFLEEKNNF